MKLYEVFNDGKSLRIIKENTEELQNKTQHSINVLQNQLPLIKSKINNGDASLIPLYNTLLQISKNFGLLLDQIKQKHKPQDTLWSKLDDFSNSGMPIPKPIVKTARARLLNYGKI